MNRVPSLVRAVPPEPDAALLDRFRAARDDAAFAELVRRYGPLVERPTAVYVTPTMAVGHLTFRRAGGTRSAATGRTRSHQVRAEEVARVTGT